MEQRRERVSLVRCLPERGDDGIRAAATEAIGLLGDLSEQTGGVLGRARTVAVKINAGIHRANVLTDGRQTELSDPAVVEAVIQALREVTDAEIIIGDASTDGNSMGLYKELGLPERLSRFRGVRLVDFNQSEIVEVTMPHAGETVASGTAPMFRRYFVPREIAEAAEAGAVVSVSKMKAHQSIGCTLCIKNLFGWMPTAVYGAPRHYLHDRLIRLPRVLSDIARWLKPCLNVVDGIVAANKSEWGGEALRPGVILAGTNIVATDSVGARVMGFDPEDDYPNHPFLYRRNTIKLAAQGGLGPLAASEVTVVGEKIEGVVTPFAVQGYDAEASRAEQIARRNEEVRRGAACAAAYLQQRDALLIRYGSGQYLALRDGEVLWDASDMATLHQRERESGLDWRDGAQLTARCLPPDEDPEVWEWYAAEVERLPEA
jgi:uncharacterized protein (DUF362 family)